MGQISTPVSLIFLSLLIFNIFLSQDLTSYLIRNQQNIFVYGVMGRCATAVDFLEITFIGQFYCSLTETLALERLY